MTADVAAPAVPSMDPEARRAGRSAMIGLAGAAANAAFGFVLTLVLVRGFGAAGSGAVFTAIAVASIAGALCCAGADTALLWALPRRRPDANPAALLVVALLPTLLGAGAVALAGVYLAESLAAVLFEEGGAGAALLRVAAVAVPATVAMTVLLAAVRALRPVGAYVAVQSLLVAGSRPLLIVAVVAAGAGTVLAATAWAVPIGVAVLVALALLGRPLAGGATARATAAQWRGFWAFALPRGASAAIDASSMWVGVLLTAALAGPAQAGIFSAVGRYALAGLLIMHGLRVATAARLSRLLAAGRTADAVAVYRRTTGWIIVLSWPGFLVLAAFAPGLLSLFGAQFTAGATALAVLSAAMVVNCGVGIVQTMLLMGGHSGRHLAATTAGLAANLAFGVALIPRHGALGAAIAWAIGIVVENVLAAIAARKVAGEPLVDRTMRRVALGTAVAGSAFVGLGLLVGGRGVGGLAVATVGLAAAFAVLLSHRRGRAALTELTPSKGTR